MGNLNGPEPKLYFLSQISVVITIIADSFSGSKERLISLGIAIGVAILCILLILRSSLKFTKDNQEYQLFMSRFETQTAFLLSSTALLKAWRTASLLSFFPLLAIFVSFKDLHTEFPVWILEILFHVSIFGVLISVFGFLFFHLKIKMLTKNGDIQLPDG
ncbi:MAG TPA: hypothetical protein PLV64_23705 [Anaerolineales bacterium]|nr:hypothetical protein [Anaerolineales bacterium]